VQGAVAHEPLIGAEDKRKALDTIRERGLNPDQARAFIMEHGYTRDEASAIMVEDSDWDQVVGQRDVPANWRQMRLPGRPAEPNVPDGPTLPYSHIGQPEVASGVGLQCDEDIAPYGLDTRDPRRVERAVYPPNLSPRKV
jgi:hypothetical protein